MFQNLIPVLLLGLPQVAQSPLPFDPADIDPARLASYEAERARRETQPRPVDPSAPCFDPALVAAQALGVGEEPDGSVVASGPTWHGRWSDGRLRFQELGGPRGIAPAALELELLEIVRESAPGSRLALDRSAPNALERAELAAQAHLRRALADGVSEHWDLTPRGAELYYELERLPPGEGELIVRLAATTALVAPFGRGAPGQGLAFAGPQGTGIDFGAVTGVDAHGATCPGSLVWDGTHLELRLPAEFVDAAALPLVVDPFLSGFTWLFGTYASDTSPDVAWDEDTQTWGVAFRRFLELPTSSSGGYGTANYLVQRLNAWGAIKGPAVKLGTSMSGGTTVFSSRIDMNTPSIVNVNGFDEFVVVVATPFKNVLGYITPTALHVMRVKASDGTHHMPATAFHTTWKGEIHNVALGTDPLSDYPSLLVVWDVPGWPAGAQVRCMLVELTSTYFVSFGPENIMAAPSSSYYPQVSPSAGTAGRWLVTWENFLGSPTSGPAVSLGIEARTVRYNGLVESIVLPLGAGRGPRVAGNGVDFVVQSYDPIGGGQYRYKAQAWRYVSPTTLHAGVSTTLGNTNLPPNHHDITMLGDKYLSIWRTCSTAGQVRVETALFGMDSWPVTKEAAALTVPVPGVVPGDPTPWDLENDPMSFRLASMGESKSAAADDQVMAVCSKNWVTGPIHRIRIWN